MRRFIQRSTLLVAGLSAAVALAACTGAAATPAPTARPAAASPGGAATMGSGTFHDVDGAANGDAALIHLADGGYKVVFEAFSIPNAAHTNVILVKNPDVAKTVDVDQKAFLDLGPLKSASGMQDFPVPAAMMAGVLDYHTVVLWDTQMAHAVAAAPLKP